VTARLTIWPGLVREPTDGDGARDCCSAPAAERSPCIATQTGLQVIAMQAASSANRSSRLAYCIGTRVFRRFPWLTSLRFAAARTKQLSSMLHSPFMAGSRLPALPQVEPSPANIDCTQPSPALSSEHLKSSFRQFLILLQLQSLSGRLIFSAYSCLSCDPMASPGCH